MEVLTEKEAEDFLEANGLPVAERRFVRTEEEAMEEAEKLGYPVALKVVGKEIIHKTDVGGVKLDLRSREEVKKAFLEIERIKGFQGALVQKFVQGFFLLLGLKNDRNFGQVIVLGTGGIYTEILKDATFRVCPITKGDAEEMIREIKSYEILKGARGGKSVDFNKIINVLLKLSELTTKYKNIEELDINPLLVNENYVKIVDARIVFS